MLKRMVVIVLVVLMGASLCGCRYSEVLQEILYTMDTDLVDMSNDDKPIENTRDSEQYTEEVQALEVSSDATRQSDEMEDLALAGDTASPVTAVDSEQTQIRDPDRADPNMQADAGAGSADAPANTGSDGTMLNPVPSNRQDGRQVVDEHGGIVELPQDVSTVAAAGEVATIVRMLGGPGSLVATDASTLSNALTCAVWPDLGEACQLWDNGTASQATPAAFDELVALKPEAVVASASGSLLDDGQIAALAQYDIAYVVLPALTDYESIKQAVAIVGSIMADPDSAQIAQRYAEYVDAQVKDVTRSFNEINATQAYTVLLAGWDPTASYSIHSDSAVAMSGSGAATTFVGAKANAINALFSPAGVINTPALYSTSAGTIVQYAIPFVPVYHAVTASGEAARDACRLYLFSIDDVGLGSASFPAVIAASADVGAGVATSPAWQVYDVVASADQRFTGRGFLDQNGIIVNSQISAPYRVYVNPQGVGVWWDGSAESVLELPWLANRFFQTVADDDLRARVADFYQRFYGYDLSEGQIDAILEGS